MYQKWSFRPLILAIALCAHAHGNLSEYLDSFHADIIVHADASLTVREEITYVNVSRPNRHGIVRDFPTHYFDEKGTAVRVAFEIVSIERDGKQEPFKTVGLDIGTRILIGSPETTINPGTYRYVITYDTNRQVLLHDDLDELYWNVNGNWWVLPINEVSATVRFPVPIPDDKISIYAYTGILGASGRDYRSIRNTDGSITITSTRPFAPREGLTISLAIPKGIVHYPTLTEQLCFFAQHHAGTMLMIIGFLAILLLCLVSWIRLRRTRHGVIIPLFHPVPQLSPSAHRYIASMGLNKRQIAADIVQLAVEGFLRIEQITSHKSARYRLIKLLPENRKPTTLQQQILDDLFGSEAPHESELLLTPNASNKVIRATEHMGTMLHRNLYTNILFVYRYLITGVITTLLLGVISYNIEPAAHIGWLVLITLLLPSLTFIAHRTYTPAGQKLGDQVRGFLLYLKTAESERLELIGTPPTKTPALYETYLPYAMALGAEKQWSAQFTPVFEELMRQNVAYRPVWFIGPVGRFNPTVFAHDMTTFARSLAIPVQSSPTHVKSGIGGGGFSGGGRGGGGGGSW